MLFTCRSSYEVMYIAMPRFSDSVPFEDVSCPHACPRPMFALVFRKSKWFSTVFWPAGTMDPSGRVTSVAWSAQVFDDMGSRMTPTPKVMGPLLRDAPSPTLNAFVVPG